MLAVVAVAYFFVSTMCLFVSAACGVYIYGRVKEIIYMTYLKNIALPLVLRVLTNMGLLPPDPGPVHPVHLVHPNTPGPTGTGETGEEDEPAPDLAGIFELPSLFNSSTIHPPCC